MTGNERTSAARSMGAVLRARRMARGLTQREAAARAGVSVGAWRSTESGARRPRPSTFAAILESLDLTLEDVRSTRSVALGDVDSARRELARRCRDELPAERVALVLEVVDLAIAATDVQPDGSAETTGASGPAAVSGGRPR